MNSGIWVSDTRCPSAEKMAGGALGRKPKYLTEYFFSREFYLNSQRKIIHRNPFCCMGAQYFGIHPKKGGTYNPHLDPQSKFKLDEAYVPPTDTIVFFVPQLHAIVSESHRDHHQRTHQRTQQTSSPPHPLQFADHDPLVSCHRPHPLRV